MAQTTYSDLSDIRLAAMIMQEVNFLLADPTNLLMYPGIFFAGDVNGTGSDTLRQRFINLGFSQLFSSENDGAEVSATTPSDSNVDYQVGRYALRYDITSLAQMTGYGRDLDPITIAQGMIQSATATASDVIASTFASFTTNTAGNAAQVLTVDDMLDAIFELENGSNTQAACILHTKQFGDFRQSLRNESNNVFSFAEASREMMKMQAPGYRGEWAGVGMYSSNRVKESAGAKQGVMIGADAIGYILGSSQDTELSDRRIAPAGTPVIVEWNRNPAYDRSEIVANMYMGASISEQERGCLVTSVA
jgi:hypothetical protein